MRKLLLFCGLFLLLSKPTKAQCNGSAVQCIGTQSYTVTPAAVNGLYSNGTVVTFCYTMTNYSQCNSNWFHTLDIDLGPGWDASSIAATSIPNSCDGQGDWGFYTSVTSASTGNTYGPCFSYDSPLGNPLLMLDGIPGNNFGDNCTSYSWTFCFSVQVAAGCSNQSLSVDVTPVGDGSGGSWTWPTCPGLPLNICNATCTQCPLDVFDSITNPSCLDNDGQIMLSVDSAQGSVTYSWLPGGQSTSNVNGLSSGIYSVTVTDSVGCSVKDTFEINFVNPVVLNTQKTNATCNGFCNGTAYIFPSNGMAPYSYSWSSSQTSSFDSTLCAGIYYVTVTDANSCQRFDTIVIDQPAVLVLSPAEVDASCFGSANGMAIISVSGGSGGYSYLWSPTSQTNDTAFNLLSGDYIVEVTDTAGCIADTLITIGGPSQILFNAQITDPTCYNFSDGSIITNVSQGQPPYQYLWENSGGTASTLNNLAAGSYSLLVTDANGCAEQDTLFLTQPDSLVGTLEVQPSSCIAATDGSIGILVSGGTQPYVYEWDNNTSLIGSALYGQSTGSYTVVVTDAQNCVLTMNNKIPAMAELAADAGQDTAIELGNKATLHAEVSRTGIFNYQWTPGYHVIDSFAAITDVYPYFTTTYRVSVTEVNSGCMDDDSVTVKILPTDFVIFPTGFTPNGDGVNDIFQAVSGTLVSVESFKIINRWGNVVFDDKTQGWDGTFSGKPEEVGTYVYEITYKVEGRDDTYFKEGSVTLLR